MHSFIRITCNSWKLESVMLACEHVIQRHTGENIATWYDEIIADFNIALKVKHIPTDSAANVKEAFVTIPGYEISGDETDDEVSDLGDDESHLYDDEYQTDLLNAIGDLIKGIYLKKHNSPWIPICPRYPTGC